MEEKSAAAAGGGAGAAPFLVKTYEMIEDRSTDEIVSWSSNNNSFVVWNPPEFERLLLPTYFKHNNFSSFIRQLNTYGFRKIDPEKWEFANEEFVKDQKHLLKNIHRRKPIHSHSHPQGSSVVDPERAAFEEEIEKLSREKSALEADVLRSKQQCSAEKLQLEDLTQRVDGMENRQEKLQSFLEKAIKNPTFIQYLTCKAESMDFSSYSKKRRLPQVDHCQQFSENSFLDNLSSSRPEFGNIIHQDCSNTVALEFSPSRSDINLVSHSAHSSNEDGTPQMNVPEGDPKYAQMMEECPLFASETLELSDTGTSSKFRMECSLLQKMADGSGPGLLSLHQSLDTATTEDTDCHISCQLNLTLASSPLQVNRSHSMAKVVQANQELSGSNANFEERVFPHKNSGDEVEAPNTNQGHVSVPQVQVNDGFWAQFFTERPGSSDIEEASSSLRAKTYNEKEDRRLGNEMFRNEKSMDQLTL